MIPWPVVWPAGTVSWFTDRHWGVLVGFGLVFVFGGFSAVPLALITHSIRRMSVSPVFAYSYLILYAVLAACLWWALCRRFPAVTGRRR